MADQDRLVPGETENLSSELHKRQMREGEGTPAGTTPPTGAGRDGGQLVPGETENLSSSYHQQGDASLKPGAGDIQRGAEAGFDPKTGAVHGSGANAGAGGTPGEDYDTDSHGGGTKPPVQVPR